MMKTGWYAHEDKMTISFANHVGFIEFIDVCGCPYFAYWLSEGTGGRETRVRRTSKFNEAVDFIERFSELSFDEANEQFEMMVKEACPTS